MALIDQTWYERPEGALEHAAAGGVVCRLEGDTVLVALAVERGYGALVLPKGHVEAGESIEEAARREVSEETGLSDLTLLAGLGTRERLSFSKAEWKRTHYYLYATRQVDAEPTDHAHHEPLQWHPLRALPELFWPEQAELLSAGTAAIEAAIREWSSAHSVGAE